MFSELLNKILHNLGLVVDTSSSKKLLDACTFGRISEAFTLLRNGTNPNIVDHENRSPLMLILESKGEFDKNDEDFVHFLIQKIRENGGDLDIKDNTNGTTALIKACAKSRTSAALQLIEAGASLDFVDVGEEDKLTALDYAIGRKLDIVVNAIRKKGGHTFQELDSSTANTLNDSLSSNMAHVVASASLPYKESTLIWKQGTGAANTGSVFEALIQSDSSRQACISSLVALILDKNAMKNADMARNISKALWNISSSEIGRQACIDSGVPLALVALSGEKAVKENADAATKVAFAFKNISGTDAGCQFCIDAGAHLALTALSRENAVKNKLIAAMSVTQAFEALIQSDSRRRACISSIVTLILDKNVMENTDMARNISKALYQISSSEIGRQACIDAGVPHSFINWTCKKSSRENDLIWIQGTGAANTGSVLVILAQNGYTQQAHQIIGLSRTASLIGRDSDGGLPELWDVMSQFTGRDGMTRLMAIARVNGRLSPVRARALIRDHKADPMKSDKFGCSAIEWAVRNGNVSCLDVFLENDIDGNVASKALIHASYWNQEMTVKMLLARGARQVPFKNFIGSTAMHHAVNRSNISVLTLLCNAPDAVDAMNITDDQYECGGNGPLEYRSPLYVARKEDKKECIAVLLSIPSRGCHNKL